MPSRPLAAPRQRSFDDLDVMLADVTFCAIDLETTSGSWKTGEIIEIGAVKSRGGEVIGTFETFVEPSVDIPVEIQLLTGITPSMLTGALPLPTVMPSLLEFMGNAVFVAHNARFDKSFIDAACIRLDYDTQTPQVIDTARLARRILRNEVRNCRLQTLAAHFRTPHTPNHRAFPDAAACLEVLYELIGRASAYGVVTLADLLDLQSLRSDPHFEKVKMARSLPQTRGVYLFLNKRAEIIYVGKATNLRARVRSYFTSDERKRMSDLRAEVCDVRTIGCATDLEACALEARMIERYQPRYNRALKRRRAPVYLKLTADRHPRFAVARRGQSRDSEITIGPFRSQSTARTIASSLSGLFGLRTCTLRLNGETHEPCALYALGSCHGPCTGLHADIAKHDAAATTLRADLLNGLTFSKGRLAQKLEALCARERFEEAAEHRDAFAELVRTIDRAQRLTALAEAGRIELETPDGPVALDEGRLARGSGGVPRSDDSEPLLYPPDHALALAELGLGERQAVASWFERAAGVRLIHTDEPLAYPWPRTEGVERIELAE